MGILRNRRGDGDRDETRRYQMQQRLLSIGDDSWIEDDQGRKAFLVDGKALRVRDTWVLKDARGDEVAEIKERKLSVRDAMKIHVGGREATVKKALVGIRDRYHIELDGGDDLKAHGNIVDHEYEIEGDDGTIGTISKKWFRVRDTYGVEVAPGVDPALVLSITVAIDALSRGRD
jgi:uncharacterized protein YxjI